MNQDIKISASLVLYRHRFEQISELVSAIGQFSFPMPLYVVDNSPTDALRSHFDDLSFVTYLFPNENLGYGKAHNIAIKQILDQGDYHLVLNPDIIVNEAALKDMLAYLQANVNVGLLMPKVLYANGETQYLCKLFPTPFDLIMRRFIPSFISGKLQKRLDQYELKHKDYKQMMEVPNLSGCFMLLRVDVLNIVGLFDESFFMYLEDTDLSRRINMQFKTIYYPKVSIVHHYEKGSYKSFKLLKYHIVSAFRYFNKYGWFFDTVRTTVNGRMKA